MNEIRKPKPKHIETVCDVCGLDWKRHGKAPTTDKCIELLKADLASEKARTTPYQPVLPRPYPVPYPRPYRPWPNPQLPYWTTIQTRSGMSGTPAIGGADYTVRPVSH